MAAEQPVLQFLPLSTSIAPSFWHALTSLKLHRLKLDDAPLELTGHYAKGRSVTDKTSGQTVGISGALELDEHSFQLDHVGARCAPSRRQRTGPVRSRRQRQNVHELLEGTCGIRLAVFMPSRPSVHTQGPLAVPQWTS